MFTPRPEHFPVLVAQWSGDVTHEDVDAFKRWAEGKIADARTQGLRVVVVQDTTDSKPPTPAVRKAIADWVNTRPKDEEPPLAVLVVVKNAVIRGVLTAMRWLVSRTERQRVTP
jgi:hypothetical protein